MTAARERRLRRPQNRVVHLCTIIVSTAVAVAAGLWLMAAGSR